jgi:hypothetical protein
MPVTVCQVFGKTSQSGDKRVSRSYHFYVPQRSERGWGGRLLTGPGVGSIRGSVVIKAGASREFRFRLNSAGRPLLVLRYGRGEGGDEVRHAKPRLPETFSNSFAVEALYTLPIPSLEEI